MIKIPSILELIDAGITESFIRSLREDHGYHIIVIPTVTGDWTFKIVRVASKADQDDVHPVPEQPPYNNVHAYDYSTHDQAQEAAIEEVIKIMYEAKRNKA